jgi:acyl-coenzyme A thioesterase PaaI-like protein
LTPDQPKTPHQLLEAALGAELTPRRAAARRMGDAVRRLVERVVGRDAPIEAMDEVAAAAYVAAEGLEVYRRRGVHDGWAESANSGDPYAFFDRSPTLGRANPLAPPIDVEIVDGVVVGRARFGAPYEGPPGCVHGGFIAASFDDVLGIAQSLSGNGGMTGTLTVRYRRPTPLHEDVVFEARLDRVEGRKIFTAGLLIGPNGEVTAEAEAIFISVPLERFEELMRAADARNERNGGDERLTGC